MTLNLVHRHRVQDTKPDQRVPAVVMVHGWLGNENVMSIFDRTLPRGFAVVSVRGPEEIEPGNFAWMRHLDDVDGFRQGLAALRSFVTALPDAFPVLAEQIYLMGFSQGAAMSLALLLSDPKLIAGVAALAGFIPEAARSWATPGMLAGKPVFIAHGVQDATVPIAKARDARDTLGPTGADLSYHEYAIGHKLNAQGMADLKAWWQARTTEA